MREIRRNRNKAFTLSELLIALAILGVIATFTIPKVLQSQQDSRYKSIAKETAAMISDAYVVYKSHNTVSPATKSSDLTPYMNYVKVDTVTVIDYYQASTTDDCSTGVICLKLHNGSILTDEWGPSFTGTATTNAIHFLLDPDGKETDGTTNGPGKSVRFYLYYNGRIATYASIYPNTKASDGTRNPNPALDPPWFSWD